MSSLSTWDARDVRAPGSACSCSVPTPRFPLNSTETMDQYCLSLVLSFSWGKTTFTCGEENWRENSSDPI